MGEDAKEKSTRKTGGGAGKRKKKVPSRLSRSLEQASLAGTLLSICGN